jgi:hypothetical protein
MRGIIQRASRLPGQPRTRAGAVAGVRELRPGLAQRLECGRGGLSQAPSGGGGRQPAAAAGEQRRAQRILQQLDLPADRAMGHVQLLRGPRHAAQAGRGLEGAQGIERRQVARHVSFPDVSGQTLSLYGGAVVR